MAHGPVPSTPAGLDRARWRRAAVGRVWIVAVLIVMEVALAIVAGIAWRAERRGEISGGDVAAIGVMGAGAVVGVAVLLTVGVANLRAIRERAAGRPATAARAVAAAGVALALIRLGGLLVAGVVLAVASSLTGDLTDACTLAVAAADALLGVLVAVRTTSAVH